MTFLHWLRKKWKLIAGRIEGLPLAARVICKPALILTALLVRIENEERLAPLPAPVIFALNHNAYFETILVPCFLMAVTGQKISFFTHWMFNFFPVIGWAARQIDPIWVFNRRARFRALRRRKPTSRPRPDDEAVRRLHEGISVGIFPEGNRNNHPHLLLRGRMGLGEIVYRTGLPVVPIGIDFPKRRKHHRIPTVGRIILRIGEPIPADRLIGESAPLQGGDMCDPRERTRLLYRKYQEISHVVMRRIAALSGKIYPF